MITCAWIEKKYRQFAGKGNLTDSEGWVGSRTRWHAAGRQPPRRPVTRDATCTRTPASGSGLKGPELNHHERSKDWISSRAIKPSLNQPETPDTVVPEHLRGRQILWSLISKIKFQHFIFLCEQCSLLSPLFSIHHHHCHHQQQQHRRRRRHHHRSQAWQWDVHQRDRFFHDVTAAFVR